MANIFIDLLGEPEEEVEDEKTIEPEPEARRDRQLIKQVISIDGEVVDDPYA